jgi:hypothetical protein
MAKGRHLKPDFFTDKHVVSVSPLARLLYQGLWCYAADCGHLDDEPIELKMRILPADNCDVDTLLDELAERGRIERNDGVIYVPNLGKHSRIDKRYETHCDACKEACDTTGKAAPSTPNPTGTPSDHTVTTPGTQRDHDADGDGDGDGDGEVRTARKRATQLPDSFVPSDKHQALAIELGVDLRREWVKFTDHARAKGSTYKDWGAALNNWIRRAAEYGGNVRPLRPTSDEQGRVILPPLPKGVFEQ